MDLYQYNQNTSNPGKKTGKSTLIATVFQVRRKRGQGTPVSEGEGDGGVQIL